MLLAFNAGFRPGLAVCRSEKWPKIAPFRYVKNNKTEYHKIAVSSRSQTLDVARENRGLLDVRKPEHILCKPLKADRPAAFRRDTVLVHHEIILKIRLLQSLFFQTSDLLIIPIDAHTAGGDFAAESDQVK